MAANDFARGEHVKDEQEGTKHRTLGDALGQMSKGGSAIVDIAVLAEGRFKMGNENCVVDCVKGCCEVKKDEN